MLKFLGELGLVEHQAAFVHHILDEIVEHGELRRTRRSVTSFWSQVVRDEEERTAIAVRLHQIAEELGAPGGDALGYGGRGWGGASPKPPRLTDLGPSSLHGETEEEREKGKEKKKKESGGGSGTKVRVKKGKVKRKTVSKEQSSDRGD
jgi:hypothetical protein